MPQPVHQHSLRIHTYGEPCLRRRSEFLSSISLEKQALISDMIEAMYEFDGVGLAAPQVGINLQIFVADIGDGPLVVINPRVLSREGAEVMEEGCLSLPDIAVAVKRPTRIRVSYLDENDQPQAREFSGMAARVFLHETDHLNGKMIIDYAGWRQRFSLRKQLKELAQERD